MNPPITFQDFAMWALAGLLTLAVFLVAWFMKEMLEELKGVHVSIADLNKSFAVIGNDHDWHGKEIAELKTRQENGSKAHDELKTRVSILETIHLKEHHQ